MNIVTAQNIIYRENLTLKAQAVFTYLADRSNKQNICWPGLKRIAMDCRISVSTVQRAIKELLQIGLLIKKPNYRENGSQTSNLYIVNENLEEKENVKKENRRVQRKIEEKMKRQAKKERLVAMFKEALELGSDSDNDNNAIARDKDNTKELENCNADSTNSKNQRILTNSNMPLDTISRPAHKIETFLKKINLMNPLNFNFLPWGVVRKNTQEPKHIIFTDRKIKNKRLILKRLICRIMNKNRK